VIVDFSYGQKGLEKRCLRCWNMTIYGRWGRVLTIDQMVVFGVLPLAGLLLIGMCGIGLV
jgi:hypothetical protein